MSDVVFGHREGDPEQPHISNWDVRHRRAEQEARLSETLQALRRKPSVAYNPDDFAAAGAGTITGAGWFARVAATFALCVGLIVVTLLTISGLPGGQTVTQVVNGQSRVTTIHLVSNVSGVLACLPAILGVLAAGIYLLVQFGRRAKDAGFSGRLGIAGAVLTLIAGVAAAATGHGIGAFILVFGLHLFACLAPTAR